MAEDTKKGSSAIKKRGWEALPERLLFHDSLVVSLLARRAKNVRLAKNTHVIVAAFNGSMPKATQSDAVVASCEIDGLSFLLLESATPVESVKAVIGNCIAIGIASTTKSVISTPDILLCCAASALEKAKTEAVPGVVSVTLPSEEDQGEVQPIPEITDPGLSLVFQPQARVSDNSLSGVEVLARVPGENGGTASAERFFAGADRQALARFDRQILQRSLSQATQWRASGLPPINIAVNFPLDAFERPGSADLILEDLTASAFPPACLVLELTEVAPAHDLQTVARELGQLKDAGIGLALDDLGRGYASLGLLYALPLTRVKVDRVFIDKIDRSAKLREEISALVQVAKAQNLTVLAEGVERETQRAYLGELGCDYYQGFLYNPALPLKDFEAVLAHSRS